MRTKSSGQSILNRRIVRWCFVSLLFAAGPLTAQQPQPAGAVAGFSVLNMRGRPQTYRSFKGKVTVVIFFSTRCPMSNAFNYRRNILYHDYKSRVRFLMIDANSNESLEEVRAYAEGVGFDFPVFQDARNEAAERLGVRATTDTFVIDLNGVIRYRGYIENSPNPERATIRGLRLAIDAVLAGQTVAMPQTKPIGCAIRRTHP